MYIPPVMLIVPRRPRLWRGSRNLLGLVSSGQSWCFWAPTPYSPSVDVSPAERQQTASSVGSSTVVSKITPRSHPDMLQLISWPAGSAPKLSSRLSKGATYKRIPCGWRALFEE